MAGRMTSRAAGAGVQSLTWDPLSRLVQLTSAGVAQTYLYDGSGQRVATMGEHTASVFLGASEATDADTSSSSHGDVIATRFYTSGGATVAVRDATGVSFLFGDVQGSATVMMAAGDPVTATVSRTAYTPFGARRGDETLTTDRGFLGQVEDTSTGLTYLNARYYDPTLGRFLSPDPVLKPTDPTTLDPYAYAANNPITYTDASGLTPSCAGPGGVVYSACSTYAATTYNYLTGQTVKQHNLDVAKRGTTIAQKYTPVVTSGVGSRSKLPKAPPQLAAASGTSASLLSGGTSPSLNCDGTERGLKTCVAQQGNLASDIGRRLQDALAGAAGVGGMLGHERQFRVVLSLSSHLESTGPAFQVLGTGASVLDSYYRIGDLGLRGELNGAEQAGFVVLRTGAGAVGGVAGSALAVEAFTFAVAPTSLGCGPLAEACFAIGEAGASSIGGILGDSAATWLFDRAVDAWGDDYLAWRPWH